MLQTSSPAVSRRWLAFEMKRLRQFAGLSQAAVAKAIGSQVPKISLIESGHRNVQERDLQTLLPLFDVRKDRWDEYFSAARHAHEKGWWDIYDPHTVPGWLRKFVGLEQGAERLRTYQPAVFPGLLQTPEYASAILRRTSPPFSDAKIEGLVELRIRRQEALRKANNPLHMWAVVDEAVLRRVVGSHDVMRMQLEHVANAVGQTDHIHLQVVPFTSGAAYEAAYGAFAILTFGWLTDPGFVYLEHPSNAEFLESLADTEEYSVLFRRVCDLALPQDDSLAMLRASIKEFC